MSLSCLTCQVMERTNSDRERDYGEEKYSYHKIFRSDVRRSWSGNLGPPPPYNNEQTKSGSMVEVAQKKAKKGHRRLYSTGAVAFEGTGQPKLIRSSGMRRDWSFENLRQCEENKKGRLMLCS